MNRSVLFITVLLISCIILFVILIGCTSISIDSVDLFTAWNTAQMTAISNGLLKKLNDKYPLVKGKTVYTCTPHSSFYKFPDASNATGSLRHLLDVYFIFIEMQTRELLAGGIEFDLIDGNYSANPPTGFWPEYIQSVVDELNNHYFPTDSKKITITHKLYGSDSEKCIDELQKGNIHLLQPYFVIGAFYQDAPRSEMTRVGCTSLGFESQFEVLLSTGVTDVNSLYNYLYKFDISLFHIELLILFIFNFILLPR